MTAEIFKIVVYSWIILAIATFILLFFVTAPFGRHTSKTWGPMINARLAWVLMEIPSPALLSFFFFTGNAAPNTVTLIFWGLWMAHYTNRTFIYPLRQRDHGKKMPIMIMGSAISFNFMNAFVNGYFLGNYGNLYTEAWLSSPQFIIGITLFIVGMSLNIQSDNILLNLRKPGETSYKIPQGGLFKYISCPNLFGEILEWIGFAIMVWALPAVSFALWTFANLAPRAIAHHKWYLNKFQNYPKKRKAIIPFIW
jgi:3-oxo-5-alpha-steroid 4-dehydrogenase 1